MKEAAVDDLMPTHLIIEEQNLSRSDIGWQNFVKFSHRINKMAPANAITKHPMFHDPDFPPLFDLTPEQASLVEEHNKAINDGVIHFEEVPGLCGSNNQDIISHYDRYRIKNTVVLCRQCGLLRSNPRYTEKSLSWFYSSGFHLHLHGHDDFGQLTKNEFVELAKTRDALRERSLKGLVREDVRKVAEIGCGIGLNLFSFQQEGFEVRGCDPAPQAAKQGREMGLDIRPGSTETLEGQKFDLIILSHVLEHFADPVGEVKKIVELMNEGAGLYIEVPNADMFDISDLQCAHLYYFSPVTMIAYLAPLGLRPVSQSFADKVHVGVVFQKSDAPPDTDVSVEYEKRRQQIILSDRRDRLKDALSRAGLLPLARKVRDLVRAAT